MARSKVVIVKTSPATVRKDTHAVMNLGMHAFKQSLGILGTCIKEAPEFASRRRHQQTGRP